VDTKLMMLVKVAASEGLPNPKKEYAYAIRQIKNKLGSRGKAKAQATFTNKTDRALRGMGAKVN